VFTDSLIMAYISFKLHFLVSQYACGIFSVLLLRFRESLKVNFMLCNDCYVVLPLFLFTCHRLVEK
jgi:hypothetical protein